MEPPDLLGIETVAAADGPVLYGRIRVGYMTIQPGLRARRAQDPAEAFGRATAPNFRVPGGLSCYMQQSTTQGVSCGTDATTGPWLTATGVADGKTSQTPRRVRPLIAAADVCFGRLQMSGERRSSPRDGEVRPRSGDAASGSHEPPSRAARRDDLTATEATLGANSTEAYQRMIDLDRALEVGIVVTDQHGRPLLFGDHVRALLGLGSSTIVDTAESEVFSHLSGVAAGVAATGEPTVTSVECSNSEGHANLEVTAVPVEGDDGRRVVIQLRSLDHVRSLRQNLLEAARLRVLTRLYFGLAHDLRAPVNAIMLNLVNLRHSLLKHDDDPENEDQQTIEMVEQELRRLQRAVESILGQTAPLATEASIFDLRNVVEELEFLFHAQARQQRVALDIVQPAKPAHVCASRDSIKQAVLNIVVNAFDATSDRGEIIVEVKVEPQWVSVFVSDSGAGVRDDMVPRLFEMHATTKESGSGIGLFVARAAVQAAGGDVELVETGPGGSVFGIRLPTAEGEPVGQET